MQRPFTISTHPILTLIAGLATVTALFLTACGDDDASAESSPEPTSADAAPDRSSAATVTTGHRTWYRPPVGATWHWQLSGDVATDHDVDVYDIDLFDVPSSAIAALQRDGKRVICYFSAGSSEDWRDDDRDFPASVRGKPLADWEGEHWLDIRTEAVMEVMQRRLDLAQRKGCDGVEPDNVQSYDNDTGFDLDRSDQVAYNAALAEAAHDRGLAIGLKNAAELIPDLISHFDFSVNEECHDYDECGPYEAFVAAGKPVFNAEYADRFVRDDAARAELCAASASAGFSTLVLPLGLDDTYRISC